MNALVIGGTRNLGPRLVESLVERGFRTSVFHRGLTPATFGPEVERLYGDRGKEEQLRAAVAGRDFDVIVDTTLYTRQEAAIAVKVLSGHVGRYIALSTGQVYLVRTDLERPFREEDYLGPLMPEPAGHDLPDWQYGMDKRAAEEELQHAGFPAIWLRMPMVNSERDHYGRVAGYLARLRDGEPILVPEGPHLGLRHLYGEDAVRAVCHAAAGHVPVGTAWNLSQDEELSLEEFLQLLAGREVRIAAVPRLVLEERGLLPDCSPFSDAWMSSLSNSRWKEAFEWKFTSPREYLPWLVAANPPVPRGYAQRAKELALLPPTTRWAGFDLEAGYVAEAGLAQGRTATGLKVGYANKAVWRALKLKTLVWGHMYDDTVHFDLAELRLAGMVAPKIEPEIVLKVNAGGGVEWIAAGFEIIDCEWPGWKFKPADFVAAGGLHKALVVGARVPWRPELAEQLAAFRLRLLRNGVVVEEGAGKNALGSPLLCLQELMSQTSLAAGDLVSSGTLTAGQPIAAGEEWSIELEGLNAPGLTLRLC